MKSYLSVIQLIVRSSLRRLGALWGITAAAQCVLFAVAFVRLAHTGGTSVPGIEELLVSGRIPAAGMVSLVLTCVCLCLPWLDGFGSRPLTSLQRLRVSNRQAGILLMVCSGCFLLVFWALQLAVILLISRVYLQLAGVASPMTDIFLASWRISYVHGLMPLSDHMRLACDLVLLAALAVTTGCVPFVQTALKWIGMFCALAVCVCTLSGSIRTDKALWVFFGAGLILAVCWLIEFRIFSKQKDEPYNRIGKQRKRDRSGARKPASRGRKGEQDI